MTKAEIEARLRRVGARRERHSTESEAIQNAVASAVAEARGIVPMERVAELLGMHRSSIYELYLGDGDDRAAAGGTGEGKPSPGGSGNGKARVGERQDVPGPGAE